MNGVDLLVLAFPLSALAAAVGACAVALGQISQEVERFVDACEASEKQAREAYGEPEVGNEGT